MKKFTNSIATVTMLNITLILVVGTGTHIQAQRYAIQEGVVSFVSDAPLERIAATSRSLRGVIDVSHRTFAFTIDIASFQGFNNPLQRVHFNENYMESTDYPVATFAGKFIEDVDLTIDGKYEVRVKGKLTIHGVEKERIIKSMVAIQQSEMTITSAFTVLLEDHDIRIPKVVLQKIAPLVDVEVTATLTTDKT